MIILEKPHHSSCLADLERMPEMAEANAAS
jgi:hypothetical protein